MLAQHVIVHHRKLLFFCPKPQSHPSKCTISLSVRAHLELGATAAPHGHWPYMTGPQTVGEYRRCVSRRASRQSGRNAGLFGKAEQLLTWEPMLGVKLRRRRRKAGGWFRVAPHKPTLTYLTDFGGRKNGLRTFANFF